MRHKVISKHHNNLLVGHYGIEKTRELVAKKYFWPNLKKDVETYVKGYDIYLTYKVVKYKPYEDLQSLLVLTH